MSPRRLFGIVVLGALTLAGGLGRAHEGTDRPEGAMRGMMEMMPGMHGPRGRPSPAERPLISLALQHKEQLGLSAEQVQRLEALRADFQKEAIRRSADLRVAELELGELLRQDPVELGQVETVLKRLEGLRTELRLARLKTIEQGKAVLTPEQRQKLDALTRQGAGARHGAGMAGDRGMAEMHRFMGSERMPQAMAAMMEMASRMGDGDPMLGMMRMMEMMGQMGSMSGMMGGPREMTAPPRSGRADEPK